MQCVFMLILENKPCDVAGLNWITKKKKKCKVVEINKTYSQGSQNNFVWGIPNQPLGLFEMRNLGGEREGEGRRRRRKQGKPSKGHPEGCGSLLRIPEEGLHPPPNWNRVMAPCFFFYFTRFSVKLATDPLMVYSASLFLSLPSPLCRSLFFFVPFFLSPTLHAVPVRAYHGMAWGHIITCHWPTNGIANLSYSCIFIE